MELASKTLHELLSMLEKGKAKQREIIDQLFQVVHQKESEVKAYISLADQEDLINQSEKASGKPLRGMPISVKDNISTVDFNTTCGSRFLENFRPVYNATVIEKLKTAGAVVIGKTNMDEFAMGSSCENSAFFNTHNPHDLERVPGGSSGGSAASVAADQAICALGSDTGGSVRQPAALCGVVGLKPTYGLISRYGLVAFASSLDQIGPITKDVRDAALLLNFISGKDPKDSTSLDNGNTDFMQGIDKGIEGIKVGVPREYVGEDLSDKALAKIAEWKETFKDLGAEVVEVSLPHTEYAIPTYYLLACSEASANLARFDGVRYTTRASDKSMEEMFSRSRDQGFGEEVKRRIMLGTYALSAGYYDEFYGKAQKVRTLIKRDFDKAFSKADILLTPTSPSPAFKIGEKTDDPLGMYLSDIYIIAPNLAGIPVISIPGGKVDGLPFGLQIMGDRLEDKMVLQAAYAFEKANR